MIRNYLLVALRNLRREKFYSFINIFGLTIGLACAMLLVVYLQHELGNAGHYEKADRIYRVVRETRLADGKVFYGPETFGPLAGALREEIPEVEAAAHNLTRGYTFTAGEKRTMLSGCIARVDMLNLFEIDLVSGNLDALREPGTALVSEFAGRRLFGDDSPIGRTVDVSYKWFDGTFRIVGVMKDRRERTLPELSFSFFTASPPGLDNRKRSMYSIFEEWRPGNTFRPLNTWVLLKANADVATVEGKMRDLLTRHLGPDEGGAYHLQPLKDIYLYSQEVYGYTRSGYGDIQSVRYLTLAGGLILLIACANFINLSTARATSRAREVGMRKVSGASRKQLVFQFLGESILTSLIAFAISAALVERLVDPFSRFVGRWLSFDLTSSFLLISLGIVLLTGIFAGLYPAMVLSSYQPTRVLKGGSTTGRGDGLRRGLVVVQIAISVALVVGTAGIYKQISFIRHKDLGFDKDHILMLDLFQYRRDLQANYRAVKQEFLSHPAILKVAACMSPPGFENRVDRQGYRPVDQPDVEVEMAHIAVDEDFIDTFGLELLAGRNFAGIEPPEDTGYIINETAIARFGWSSPQDALGKLLDAGSNERPSGPVIGVVRDFHNGTLQEPIGPVTLMVRGRAHATKVTRLILKVDPTQVRAALEFAMQKWKTYLPNSPVRFSFLDHSIEARYRETIRLIDVFVGVSVMAIVIACMGLLGVVSYITHQRQQEIGIRKVLGARTWSILTLIYRDPLRLAVIGVAIVAPFAWWGMTLWLQNFAYRTNIGVGPFAAGLAVALVMGAVSVGLEGIRVLRMEPVDSLREE